MKSIIHFVLPVIVFGLFACDKSSPTGSVRSRVAPDIVRVAHIPMEKARHVAFHGSTAFVARNLLGLSTLDCADPENPTVRRVFLPDMLQPLHFEVTGTILVVADRFRGLVLLDISDVDRPTSLSATRVPGFAIHVSVFDRESRRYVAVACGGQGVTIVEISDPCSPRVVCRYTLDADFSRMIVVRDTIAYLADNFDGGMKMIDVSEPATPRLLLKVRLPGFWDSLEIEDGLLFAGGRQYGFRIFAVDPVTGTADKQEIAPGIRHLCTAYRLGDRVRNVLVAGDRAWIANGESGVAAYDVRNPSLPVLLAEHATPDEAMSCIDRNGLIYVSCWDAGVLVLRMDEG